MVGTEGLAERLDALEEPRRRAEHEAELARLQAEAADAQERLPSLVRDLEVLRARRAEAERELAQAEAAFAAKRAAVAWLATEGLPLERKLAACWNAVHAAEAAGRPAVAPAPARRAMSVGAMRELVLGWFARWRDRQAPPAPVPGPGRYLAARVRILAGCVAGGEGRPVGWVGLVPDGEVDTLTAAGRVEVLERRILADLPTVAVGVARAVRACRGPRGEALTVGSVIQVSAATRAAIRDGRLPSLELVGDSEDAARRVASLEERVREIDARFPGEVAQ